MNLPKKEKAAAEILEKTVNDELSQLNMPNLKFAVAVEPVDKPTPKGLDDIEFLFSPNPGEPLKPISRIASGGGNFQIHISFKIIFNGKFTMYLLLFLMK